MRKKIILLVLSFFVCAGGVYADSKIAKRIVSLAPGMTEILFALGLDEEIQAVSTFCDFPAAAGAKPKAGSFSEPDIEKIISCKPDLIVAAGVEQARVVASLKQAGLPVYCAEPKNITEIYAVITDLGERTGRVSQAREIIQSMRARIAEIERKASAVPRNKRVRVFVQIWHDPMMTAGKGSFIDEIITVAGGSNIGHDVVRPYCRYSVEEIVAQNPQVIILGYMGTQAFDKNLFARMGLGNVSAVRTGRVYGDIDSNIFMRPGPRIAVAVEEIYKKLYETR